MWKAIIGKSSERSEVSTSQTSRRKDEVDKSTSRHRSSESIVSSNSTRKPARGEDRDRGFNPSSTSYSSTSRTAYPGTAPASVASSYATASSNQADQTFTPPGLVRNPSLADKMPKPRDSRGERRRDSDRGQRGERRERSTSRERRSNHRARSRSRDREDKRRSTRRAYDEQQSDHDLARGLSRSGDGYVDDQSTARAGEYSAQASGNFGAQVGSSGFTQFPGQYDGGLPGSVPEPSPAPVNMSSHVPDQFPGQFPLQAAAPYRPPLAATEGGPGLAAEYYGDAGESVAHQPGVRPQAPTLIVGAEPHLQAASAIAAPPPEPSATGSVGAAASFFSGADDYQPLPSSKPPKPGKQSKPDNSSKPNRPPGAAAITGGAAMGFAAASSSMSTTHADPVATPSMSFVQQSSHDYAPPSVGYSPSTTGLGTSHHSSSAPAVPTLGAVAAGAAAGYMVGHHSSSQQSRPSGTSSSGNAGIHVTAPLQRPEPQRPHSQAHPAYAPKVSNGRPDRPGKHSSHSNVPLYAAGLAGTAGVAAAAYQSHHSPPHNSFNQPYASGSMAQRHRHRGPLSKLIDFLRDSDGVAEFEEYTEYIGVCKHCFPPGSSPRDAPRKHHYRRQGSNERYGSSTRIDKESRYWSSDGESRRTKDRSWLATGIAAYGLGKIGKSISRARENDFGGYSPRSGRGNQSRWSLASRNSDSDRRGYTSHGVTHRSPHTESRYRNRSGERVETGITAEGNLYKKDRHGSHFGAPTRTTYEARRRRPRSRSSSRDRHSRVTGAAIGAVIGSSVATSTVRHRSGSPGKRFAHTKRRSREQSPSSGSKYGKGASYNSHGGPFAPSSSYFDSSPSHSKPSNTASGGFFSSRPEKSPRRKKKSKGFFSFSNSSSSSDASLAYGYAFDKQMRSKQSTAKRNNLRNTNAAILGLGAAAAALAATDQSNDRQRRRRRDLVAVKESHNDHGKPPDRNRQPPDRNRKSRRSSMTSESDDGVWEDASEDDDSSSVSSGLAYGGAARRSQESLLSEGSGTSKWGWRWGSSKKKKDPGYPVSNVGQTMTLASSGLGALGARLTGEAPTFDNRDGAMSSASSLPSLQHVHPIPTSDPSRFDISRQSATTSYSLPIVTSRPAAIPLQQPQPILPVSSAVYATQAPYSHPYSAPTGPPVFSGVAQVRPTVTDIQRTRMTSSPEMAMPGTFPFQQSEVEKLSKEASIGRPYRRRDSSPAARAEIVGPTSSSRRKRASTQGQGSSVRSDVVKEQADKERRDRRRQEEEEEANRQAVRLREGIDRELREKRRKRRLKDEEDAEEERFRLDASKKQSERHNRDKQHTPEKEDSTQIHSSPYRSEEPAAFRGEEQRRALASTTKSIAGTKRDGILRSETQSPGDQERASEESNNLASWSTPGVIGAAGAVIVAAAAEKKAVSVEDYQTKRRSEQPRSRDSVQNGSGKLRSSMRQSPSQASDDVRDQEVQVTRKVGSKAAPSPRHEDYATYFAPPELLARSGKQQQDYSPNTDDEGAVFQIPHYITIEPSGRKSPCYSPADAFNEVPYGHGPDNRVSLPWSVPMLNLTKPTPPHSNAGSSRGDASPMVRSEDATVADINQPEKPSTASRVTWGEPEYTEITPLESREGFISDPPAPPTREEVITVVTMAPSEAPAMVGTDIRGSILPVDEVTVRHMPGEFGDDLEFAATLAAGLQDTGFDPAIVIDDLTYRRRDSPPGSESINFYRQPFFETVTDLHLESPGTEGAPPQRGFIEGELPSTPRDEGFPNVSGDTAVHSSRKEKRKGSKAAKGIETDGASTTRDSLSKPTTTDDILREPGVCSEEPESMVSILSGPSGYLVGPANPIKSERDHSKNRTEATKVTGPRSASRSRTDPQEYFDDQQTIQRPSIHRTKQDSWNMDLAASVPLPEDGPDELSSLKGLSIDNLKDNRASTNEAETPISRHVVPTTGVPRTKGTRPESSSDLTHKSEQLETRTDRRASSPDESPDDSPSKYAVSSTVIPPDTQEDEDQGKRKKKSKRVSIPDDWSDRDSRPMSAGAAEQDEYQKPRKSKKKSKRDTVVVDDAVSAASAPAALEDDKTSRGKSKKDKKDKKGGLFGLFGSSKSYEDTPEVRKAPSEATVEDFQERKKSKSKPKDKDRSFSEDVYDVYGAAAQSVGDLSQIGQARDDNKDRKPQRSKDKEQRRRSRKEGTVESGITTQDLPSKHEQRTPSSEETPPQGTQLDTQIQTTAETQDNMVSFLGVGNDIPSVPDGVEPALSIRTGEDLSQATQPALQFKESFSEPSLPATVRTPSPQRSDLAKFVGTSPRDAPVSPTFAPASPEHSIPGLQPSDHILVSPAVPSPTAIPLHFRTPRPSTGFVRPSALSSPATAPDSPSHVVPRTRHARPGSTEFRPLWLVERHKSREPFDPEEPYPSLPSSKTTSRSSSVHDVEDVAVTDEMTLAPSDGDFVLSVDVERSSEPQDFLDSQQPTPVATSFPLALQRDESSELKPNTLLDTELIRDTHVVRPEHLVAAPSSPPPQALGYGTTELRDNVSPAHFQDLQNLPPLPPSSNSSTYGDDELLSSSAIKDAAVAIGTSMGDAATALLGRERIAEQTSLPSDSSDHIHSAKDIVRALDTAESQQRSIESEMESDSRPGNKATEEPQWQAEPSTTSTPNKGATVDDDTNDPVNLSQAARLASVQRQRELQEQDAQDAVDSWFAPPTLKKAKKEKQSKKQKTLGKAKIDGASKELPSASTSTLGLTGEAPIVPVEALTEEHGDLGLPEGLGRRQSNDKELSLTSVPPLHHEAEQGESRAQVLPTLQSVEEDAEWPERNRKSKKGKGKKTNKKSSKPPTKSVEAVPLDRGLEAQLVPESPKDFQEAYPKVIKDGEDGREGEQPRALEKAENPDVTPEDELSVTLPSATPVESKVVSEYALPSKKSKKDKKKAKQARQAEPAIESTLKDPSPGVEIDSVKDGLSLVRISSQPEVRESEAMPSAPSSGHVNETSSDPVLTAEFVVPTKRKGKAGKKHKLDLRSGRESLLRDSILGAEEDTPRQLMIEPASMTSEGSITPAAMEHTEPVLEVMETKLGSSAAPDEPMQQDLDSGHASAIQANQTTQGNVQELSPLISAYPHPDDAPSTFELEQVLTHHQSPAMIPLPEDEDSGLDDDRTDKELPQEAEVSHVAPSSEVEKDDMLQENNLLTALESISATPVGFPADQSFSVQISPETIALPPVKDGELDHSSESMSPEEISGGHPIEKTHSVQVVPEPIFSLSENDVGLSSSPTLEAIDETPGAFRTDGTPSIQEAPELVPLPPDKDGELDISPVPKPVDETPGSFPTEETPSVKVAPELVPLPANEDLELISSPSLEPLGETPGAFPAKGMPEVTEGREIVPLPSDRNGEIDRSPSLEPSSETSAAFLTDRSPSTPTPLPLDEEVELDRSATLKALSETPGAFPTGQDSSLQVAPRVEPLLGGKNMELRGISDDERRQAEVIPRAFDDSDVMPAVTARNGDDVQQYVGLPTSVPLAEELPGAFPTRFATSVQVAPEMVPLPEDDDTSQIDALDYGETRFDIKADASELGKVIPDSQAAEIGHLGQENDVSRAAVPDTELPGAFPTDRNASVKDTPEQVPSTLDEDMDLYNPKPDDGFPVHTKDDDDGLQRTPSSSIIATPAVELPGAFPAAQSTQAQALPAYFSSPPNESVDDREEQDELQSPEYAKIRSHDHSNGMRRQASLSGLATPAIELPGAFPPRQSTLLEASPGDGRMARNESLDLGDQQGDLQSSESTRTGSDDTNDGMQQEASSSIPATPAVELPGAFPSGQSTLLQASPGDVQLPQNESLDLGDQQGNLQSSESTRTGSDDYSNGMQEKASSLPLATPGVELPGAFPAQKSSSVDVSPTDIPLPPDVDLAIFNPLEDEKYLPTPAIELPGAFPEQSTSVHISPEDVPLPPDEDMNGYKSLESDQYIATPAVKVPGAFPGGLSLGRIASAQTEQSPSAISPELISLPYNSDGDLDDTVNDSQAPRESTYGGDIVSAAELGPETVKEEVMQQGTRFPSVSTKPSTENLGLIRNGQDSKMSVPSTSALPSFDVANKALLPEAIPLPETSASTPQDVIEPPLPEDVDQDNAPIGGSLLPANVALDLDSAASISLPEGADLELRSPEKIPLPEGLDTVYPAAETTALGNAAYIESRPSETVSRQEARELESLSPEPVSLPAITQFEFTSSNTVHLPDDNDYGSISPNLVSLPYDADSDLREPLMGAGPSPTAEDISVETAASLEGPMPNESRLVAGEDVVSQAGLEEPLDEQADEVAASLFSALSRKRGKKTKKQQSALSYIEHKSPEVGVTEEPRSMLNVNVQTPPESTAGVVSEASGVLAGPSLAGNQPDGQEYSAAVDAKGLFDAEAQPLTKKGKKNRRNKNLLSPFDGQTASITSSNPNTLSDMPGDAESSVTEFPKPIQMPQPSDDTPREVKSEISTPSEGPLVRPLHLLEGLLGMSKKAKKKKGKNDKYLQDFESSSAVPEEPVASAESNREGDEGFETKRSSKSKKGKKMEKANISRGTEDTTASATNEDFPATPHLIAVERPTMAGDQQPSTTTERPENGPESATGALFKDSVQQSMSTPPLYDSVAHAEPGERDVNVNPKPRASDSDYLHEAAESQLPAENPADFPVEEQDIEPEAEPYQPTFSLKKSKKDKKKTKKNQTSIQNHEQPTSVAVSGTAYQYPTAGTSHEVTNAESESIVEPYHALRRAPSIVEPMELPQLPSDEVFTDSFTITGPPRNVVVPTEEAEDLSLQSLDTNKGQIIKEPPVITNEVSVASDLTVPEQPRSTGDVQWQPSVKLTEPHSLESSGARSFTTIPSSPDAHTLAASDLPMVTVGGPKSDKEQYTAFNQESTTANETPTASDLELAPLEAGFLGSNETPFVYPEQQSAIRSQDSAEPVNSQQEEDSWTTGTSGRASKSKKRQKGALMSLQPKEKKERVSDLYELPEGSSALLGPSHELNRSGEKGVRNPTDYDTVLGPSSVEGAEPQGPKLAEDLEGHALQGDSSEEIVSRSLGKSPSNVVLDMTASHTQPDTMHGSDVQTLTEENAAEEVGKKKSTQEDEWPVGFTTKVKNKKGKKQNRNGRSLLAAESREDASTSSTSTEKPRDGSVSPNHRVVLQQLEKPTQSDTVIVSMQDASVAAIEEDPSLARQDDDFSSFTPAKKGKKGKKSKKQSTGPAWYDETTGSGASTPAEAQAACSEPLEAEISRDKAGIAYAESLALIHTLPERSDVVLRYPDEFMEMPSMAEAASESIPASKGKGKKAKGSSNQSQGVGDIGSLTPEVLPEPANKARGTAGGSATAVLPTEDARSTDQPIILDDLPALPPSRPESRMCDAAKKAGTEDNRLRDQALSEPLPAIRPTSPTALPLESAAHTRFQDEQQRKEISPMNLPPLPESRSDSPVPTAAENLIQTQLHDKHIDRGTPVESQADPASMKSSLPLLSAFEQTPLIQGDVISTNSSEPAQSHSFPTFPKFSGSLDVPYVDVVENFEADEYKDNASRPFDATLGSATMESVRQQPGKEVPKKEKRKNKKKHKTFDWAEQEESITTRSASVNSDKELESRDEWNDLPSAASASRVLRAEQPQGLEIQSTIMPNQNSSIVSPAEHALDHHIRSPGKPLGGSQFNRDSAVHVSDSPLLPHIVPEYNSVRDSGYQDTTASPMSHSPQEFATGSELQGPLQNMRRPFSPDRPLTGPDDPHSTESFAAIDGGPRLEAIQSSRSPLRVSVELDPAYEATVLHHPTEPPINSGASVGVNWDMPVKPNESNDMEPLSDKSRDPSPALLPQHDQREPSPVESATKDRSSVLFLSSPSAREDPTDQPTTQSPWQNVHDSAEGRSQKSPIGGAETRGGDVEISGIPHDSRKPSVPQAAAAERVPNTAASHALSDPPENSSLSLFGGPVGINSDDPFEGSLPPGHLGLNSSERTPLDTIVEHSPEDSPLLKKSRALPDIGSPEREIKSMRRSATPRFHRHDELQSPPVLGEGITPHPQPRATPLDSGILSTDDFIARLSWPAVDEDNHSVDLDRVKSRNTDRHASSHSNSSARVRDGEFRSTSGQSIRSGGSINRFRTPDRDQILRPASGVSNRSASGTGTPPLRRVDRSLSGDLRAANKRSEAKLLAKQPDLGFDVDPHIPSSSTYDPIKDKGKGRVRGMTDVYEGWGDVPGSPLSPTRPPSVRRRQSMQIIDLETKLDQLASENRLLQDAKSKAERGIEDLGYTHDRNENAAKEALETRDLQLRERDSEILKLRETLELVQGEVARLTEVNKSLAATNLSHSSDHDDRYSQLQLEHDNSKEQWQQSARELEQLRQQHVHLSTGMEDIVRHEISIALNDKNAEVRRLRDELEAAKEQVRALQQQILVSKPSDDVLVTRDEDYFDGQCQQLCQHVQQWVMRFSKFSDSRPCRLTSEVTDEKITDRFDNAILDGSDVDNYLADRKRRRDVFMSVVMTMVWEFIFTRYLFGMDREQRQKLKSLEKLLGEVGPMKAVHRWRATTLMLLSRRQAFQAQRVQDTEAVVQEIFTTLATFLPPPSQHIKQAKESLRNVMKCAVDLSVEMRTQRAEYIMLPPLQPEYDTNGDLVRKVYFNAAVMNERSGTTTSNEELDAQHVVVKIVLFPLVVKKGDDDGLGNEEIVVCPAQVLVAKPGKEKKVVRVLSGDRMSVDQAAKSVLSFAPSSMDMGNMI